MPADLDLRERVLEHARQLFLDRGFSKVTIDEIASDLGISKKTLYKFYPSKEELLRASLHSMMRSAGWELERIISSDKPFVEKLAATMMTMGNYICKLRRESVVDVQRFSPSLWKELDKFRQQHIVSRLVGMIAQARDEKIFRPEVNEQVLVYMLVGSIQGAINPEVLSNQSFSAAEALQCIFTVLFEGALTDAARKEFHVFDKPTDVS
jgi:AcrR family transcriptional regulator